MNPAWSPDSKWLAYAKQLTSHLRAVYVYSLDQAKSWQVTDGMSDAMYPVFDKDGKNLYFAASTDVGLTAGWLDMSSLDHPVTRAVYVAVLKKDDPSPLAPESDEEKGVKRRRRLRRTRRQKTRRARRRRRTRKAKTRNEGQEVR